MSALLFLTVVPLPARWSPAQAKRDMLSLSTGAFPLVGLLLGALGGGCAGVLLMLGVPPFAAALLAVGLIAVLTGGLHEDGLADTMDGLFGVAGNSEHKSRVKSQRLAMMRRGDIGAYGVLALVFSVTLRASCLSGLEARDMVCALCAAAALSRVAPVAMAYHLPPARRRGLAVHLGTPPPLCYVTALVLGGLASLLLLGPTRAALAIMLTAGAVYGLIRLVRRRLGGATGDTMGASQQIAEMAILLAAVLIH